MTINLRQKIGNLFSKGPKPEKESSSLEPAPLKVIPDMKPADVVDMCVNFLKQNDGKLAFNFDTCMKSDYDNITLYAMSQKENSDYNRINHFFDGDVVTGYYFSLKLHKLSFDTMYELRFPTDKCFEFWGKGSNTEVFKKVENLFNLLSKNYDEFTQRQRTERDKATQIRLNDAVAYIKKHLEKTKSTNVNAEQKPMSRLDLIKACQELVSCPNIMVIGRTYYCEHSDHEEFDIMQKNACEQPIIFHLENHTFYFTDSDGSHTRYDLNIGSSEDNTFFFDEDDVKNETFVETEKLFNLCKTNKIVLEKPIKKTIKNLVTQYYDSLMNSKVH